MPNFTASIPHQLTRTEAKRRLQEQLSKLRQEHGLVLGQLKETWSGDRMDFAAAAMGQSITGHLIVEDRAVLVEVALPWLLGMLAGTVKQRIESDGTRLLSGPKSG